MKKLKDILPSEYVDQIIGATDIDVAGITLDSREVRKNYVFAAITGTELDGHQFIANAVKSGANTIICSTLPEQLAEGVTYVTSIATPKLLGLCATLFYGKPSTFVELVGITGTNGKTTTATLLYDLFRKLGYKCGLISTIAIYIHGRRLATQNTTPDVITLNKVLAEMVDEDIDFVFMEVSSHAVVQDRIFGLHFKGGVFTNLTHDHLDYHKTFANYRDAKKAFFDGLDSDAFALSNIDDKNGRYMLQNTKAARMTYGIENPADYKGKIVEYDLYGMQLMIDEHEMYTHLSGNFNAYNLLAVYAVASLLDIAQDKIVMPLSSLGAVEGRFNLVQKKNITGIIDYAHTPDALQKVLESIHEINVQGKRVITVVGCGGNRDKAKRPEMARIAAELSEQVILTSDNPRNEDPADILKDMEKGVTASRRHNVLTIEDRMQAIKTACMLVGKSGIILVAGKGHEKYQEIKGVKHPFDDKLVLEECLNEQIS